MSWDWRSQFYDDYLEFKSWNDERPAVLDEIFAIEVRRAGKTPPAAVLEIGFGSGHFLDWAAAKGYRTSRSSRRWFNWPRITGIARYAETERVYALTKPGRDWLLEAREVPE